MHGLTIRWSLAEAPEGALEALATYVEDVSFSRFAGLEGLRYKAWHARPGEWFEGSYVFVSDEARDRFQSAFETTADQAPGSLIVGSPPVLVEAHEVIAVVRGPSGFRSSPRFES